MFAGALEVRDYGTANEVVAFYPHEDFRVVGGATSYLHRDHLASVRFITEAPEQQGYPALPFGELGTVCNYGDPRQFGEEFEVPGEPVYRFWSSAP